ncbi:MAG: bifunctional nuclease family protein [Candidatus Latescibacterota bacterium]|nr:MAG: bifunctional nuclease family protein [Candidatus Latescibacterota bacterium]
MLRVHVSGLAMDQATHNPVVLLEAREEKGVLPIWIGHPEATAIASQLAGQSFERPLTHDLLRIVIEGFEAHVKKVIITELRGNTFFAKIYLSRGDEIFAIDARPSDSIALALRTQSPMYVDRDLFRTNSREVGTSRPEEEQASEDDPLKKYLDDLEPPDEFNL